MRLIGRLLAVMLLGCPLWTAATGPCTTEQSTVTSLRSRIKGDQDRIRQLNTGVTADELNDWANAAEEEQHHILMQSLKSGVSTLADGILDTPENALGSMDIAGVHLPNGVGSLGTGQANAIIGKLQSRGVNSTALFGALHSLSRVSGKRGTLEYMNALSKVAKSLKDTAEMGASDNSVESTEALFQLAADLAGKYDLAVALGINGFHVIKDETDWLIMSKAVNRLSNTSDAQLKALKVYSSQLEKDVKTLQQAKSQLESCKSTNIGPYSTSGQATGFPTGPGTAGRGAGGAAFNYDAERQKLSDAIRAANDNFQKVSKAAQACLDGCQNVPPERQLSCTQTCQAPIDRAQAEYDEAMRRLYQFEKDHNYGHP